MGRGIWGRGNLENLRFSYLCGGCHHLGCGGECLNIGDSVLKNGGG